MEAVTKVIEKATDLVLELFIRQVGYIVCYKNNVEELKDHVDEIKLAIERVEHQVKEAKRNGQEIEAAVLKCLEDAAHKIHQHEEFQKDEGHTKTGCSMAFLPHLWFRHRLGRRAKKMTLDVRPLLGKLKIEKVDYRNDPKSIEAALCNVGYESFGSRADIIRNIKVALEEATAKRIGVFGLGGVGKTTLVKEIAKKVEDEKLFDRVVMVSVTRDPNLRKIQGEIAYILGLRFEEESEVVRAELIRKRLKLEEENVLIILDDLWEGLDLNKLGISIDEDDIKKMKVKDIPNSNFGMVDKEKSSGNYRKCKILLTSRNREVLSTHMDVEKKWIFSVGLLNETEASTLFRKVAGVSEKESEFEAIAAEIVKKCDGLPVAIIAIGKTLRDKNMSEWKDSLEQLNKQGFTGVQKSMDSSIKLSYDHLESEELKSIFLLCAQMSHHPLIMDLIKYCIGLGILQGVHKIREARSRMEILIQKLKDYGLLLDSDSSDYYNMHDTVRDAALLIASKEQNVFTLRNGKLDEWPDKDELERCTAISLHNSNVIDELPEVLNCPQLKVFHIDSDDPSMRIPDNFFEGMTKLRVLVLTGFHLPHFPPSIKCLTNLRMLSIERCKLGGDLSIIGRLKKLRILSLSNSDFEMLPEELGQLHKLQLFDASNCSKLRVIPPNVISRLTSLEELYMRDSLIQREAEGETNRSQVSLLDDLRDLNQLVTLDICIWNAALLPRDLFFDKLNNYMIAVGNFKTLSVGDFVIPDKYEASRTLALQLKEDSNIHSLKGIKMLFKRLENFLLGEIKGVDNVLQQLNLEGFPCLKHLSIMNNSEIRYIINTLEFSYPRSAFPKLESLCLYKLENMEILCCNQLTDDSLCNLKTIKIHICHRLKNLFSSHIVRLLTKLETVEVFECSSLKEIVVQEKSVNDNNAAEDNKLKFPQLRTLKLRSLPAFTVFNNITQSIERRDPNFELTEIIAEDEHAVPSSLSLFNEQVAIPNLENLELSSINIEKIWDYQFSPTFGFGKLVKLNVDDCKRLKYLFSLPIAKNLENLKSLSVSGCEMMKEIFDTKEISGMMEETKEIIVHAAEDIIFPNLEKIKLSQMKNLKTIWPSKLNKLGSFCNLASVVIKDCGELLVVFSPHMTGRIQNLVTLNVSNCNSVQEIFDLKDFQQEDRIETKLQVISINSLKNLKHVWNKDPEGILNFERLQNVAITDCPELKHLFPTSVAKGLQKLKELEIHDCPEMEELVARMEEGSETCSFPFVFPQLTTLYLSNMPKLSFYRGSHTVEWQAMKSLALINCNKPEAFTTDTIQFQLAFSNLDYIAVGKEEEKWLRHCIGVYPLHNLKVLLLCSWNNIVSVYQFLHRIPNLEHLSLFQSFFKEALPHESLSVQEKIGTVVQLKGLQLFRMPALQNLGLERDPVLQRLDSLMIESCHLLIKLVPPSVTLTHLTYLEIESCHGLKNLMAPSTAKSLVQLRIMKVIQCEGIKEIVATEESNEETAVKVVFSKLITMELDSLTNLASFCCSKNHDFDFPLLENLVVRDCPKMKIFAEGVVTAPNLQKISDDQTKWDWEGDLNVTIEKGFVSMALKVAKVLKLGDHAELEDMWQGVVPVPNGSFSNLKSLVVERCDFLSTVIPCHILSILNNLEELEVENCDSVKVIFDVKDGTRSSLSYPLKKLTLKELPNLEHVWKEDPKGLVSFQTIKDVYVDECKGIQSLFPASVAEGLLKLETLKVQNCEELEQIVAMDEVAEDGVAKKFVFRCLTSLILMALPCLNYFYPGSHEIEIECPKFEKLLVYRCNKLTMIKSSDSQPALFSLEKAIPNVEVLSLNEKETMISWKGKFSEGLLQNVKFLWLVCFHNVGEADFLPYEFLQRVPNIEKLGVHSAGYKEIFPYQTLGVECITVLAQLKELHLAELTRLKSTGLEHSWLQPLLETLEIIEVYFCPCLTKLVQSTASFSNLKELIMSQCHGLEYLFTSSTAKSLVKLEEMSIDKCKTIKEIVAKEEDESDEDEDEIIFEQLKELSLKNLSRLVSFYNGNCILKFPSLETTVIDGCHRMEFFSHGDISAPKLNAIQVSQEAYYERWEGDLNTTMKELYFKEKVSFEFSEHLKLSEYPELEQVWQCKDPLYFRKLKTLVMENLKFLSKAIPSHLLPYLKNLEELQVQKCTSIEVIFDTKDAKQAFLLKKLTLNGLPNMKNVWDGDLQGNLIFDNLQEVDVTNCEGLKALFPASMAKNLKKLKKLRIETCQAMAEIVGKENEEAVEETTSTFVFPCLSSMTLCLMPELKCFYNRKHILQCPMLKDLRISHCGELEIFTLESQICPEAHPENHDSISKGSQPLFSIQKVTPNLEELSLNEKETMMLWHADYTANLLIRVIRLQLYCFHNVKEGDTLPYGFLQKVPNIETLAVACSDFEQVFHSQGVGVDDEVKRLLLQLKGLRLENLSKLKSIGLENSWVDTLSENLKILEVSRCSSLTKLVESPVSFTNLRELLVSKSGGLEYLFTCKTAMSLVQLRRISIEECESIKGLIAAKGDGSTQDEIIFEKLREISLNSLSSLSSFYVGNSVLKFPSLETVIIAQCPKMELFSKGFVSAPMLICVQTSMDTNDILWEGDLNATVKKMFKEKIAQ